MLGLENAARAAGYSLSVSILDDATAEAMREAVDRFVAQSVDAVVALSTYDDAAEALHSIDAPVPLVAVQVGGGEDRPAVGRGPGDRRPDGDPSPAGAGPPDRAPRRRARRTRRRPAAGPPAGAPSWKRPVRRCRSSCAATGRRRRATPPAGSSPNASAPGRTSPRCSSPTTRWPWACSPPSTRRGWRSRTTSASSASTTSPRRPYFTPPLTTVRQDFEELGRRGVQLVLARLAGEDLHPEPVPAPLLVRASTGPARPLRH